MIEIEINFIRSHKSLLLSHKKYHTKQNRTEPDTRDNLSP